jgi:hypothetical protein
VPQAPLPSAEVVPKPSGHQAAVFQPVAGGKSLVGSPYSGRDKVAHHLALTRMEPPKHNLLGG